AEDWEPEARKLREALAQAAGAAAPPHLIGRARKQCLHLGGAEVTEVLEVGGARLSYLQAEGAFSQPNARVAAAMLLWARQQSAQIRSFWAEKGDNGGGDDAGSLLASEGNPPAPGTSVTSDASPSSPAPTRDLLELYCGNGNFTVAVAPFFRTVVATEVSKPGVAAAQRNFELNGVRNAHVARMRSEDFTREWHAKRTPKGLRGAVDVGACDFSTLLVDPPRAGLDQDTLTLLKEFDHVLYISCNP
ncbi:tRNA (uracil-5-)-methyltransferase, partial [Helicosporidium sp. ATCC 50920]